MKKRTLSVAGRFGPLTHAAQPQFRRQLAPIPGSGIASRSIESQRAESSQLADCGLQLESQSKHPFLARSYSSQSQRLSPPQGLTQSQSQRLSLSQGLTQSHSSQQTLSQNSQPEDYGCDLWNRPSFLDKEISLSQPKPPSPYFAGLASRRNDTGTAGGGSTPASSTGTSSALCLVAAPQSSSPRPWPQCNVSEELERRLGGLEKLREDETALIQKIFDDYQQIKVFLEETCFEGKDNRSKLALQQNALHKLVKEEETANSSILAAIRDSGERILQDIRNLKSSAEVAGVAEKNDVSTSFERMMDSFREEVVSFKKNLKAELDAIKQSLSVRVAPPQLPNQLVPITDMPHQLLSNQSSHPQMDFTQPTPTKTVTQTQAQTQTQTTEQSLSVPEIVDLDELPDSFDTRFDFFARVDAHPAICYRAARRRSTRLSTRDKMTRLKRFLGFTDADIDEGFDQGKSLRAQRRVRYKEASQRRVRYKEPTCEEGDAQTNSLYVMDT